MSAGYRRRHIQPLYPEIPESVCDCELLPQDHCIQPEELVHTELLTSAQLDAPVDEGRGHVCYQSAHRRCPMCGQEWWLYGRERSDLTYARDDESQPVGSVSYVVGQAVRCADADEAAMLDAWLPRYLDALARRDRLYSLYGECMHALSNDALRAAIVICVELSECSAATRMLGETSARACKMAAAVRRDLTPQMWHCVTRLEARADDEATWQLLLACQRTCAEARLSDPAREMRDWTIEEWWTPALAGLRQYQFEIHALRDAAQGKALGSPQHSALRACEDAIASCWERHLETVHWPHPEVAFMALVEHALSLRPMVVARDLASWTHPDRIGRELRALLDGHQIKPGRQVAVPPWLAARTGLPDARERHEKRAAANYWLPIRRARRAAEYRARGA
ncbi:MAG: hypothetical protein AB7E72_03325 [Lysobacterales bacterium]